MSAQKVLGISSLGSYQIVTRATAKSGISVAEKVYITAAIGLPASHWYKCPNGHVYCIGECGEPYETGKCPECKADIGGEGELMEGNDSAVHMAKYINTRK